MYDDNKFTLAQQQRIQSWLEDYGFYSTNIFHEFLGLLVFYFCINIYFMIFDSLFMNILGLIGGIFFLIYSASFKPLFGFSNEEIQTRLNDRFEWDNTSQHFRQRILVYVDEYGLIDPPKITHYAMALIGCGLLFELFYIQGWVKNYQLVWQPEWVKQIILWVINNTQFPSFGVREGFFVFFMEHDDFLTQFYVNELQFLESPTADVVMLFHAIKMLTLSIFTVAGIMLLQPYIEWHSILNIEDDKIQEMAELPTLKKIVLFAYYLCIVPALIWGLFYCFFTWIIIPISTDYKIESLIGIWSWIFSSWQNISIVLPVLAFWLFWKALYFFKYFFWNIFSNQSSI